MGAPLGNQFWKLASKHGREKLFATPQLLWEAACEYFEWCDNNPLNEIDFKGKDAVEVILPKMRAYTLTGLCLYLNCNTAYFRQFKIAIADKDNEIDKEFSTIITRIEDVIYTQKFTGAAAGLLQANIISMELGLKYQTEVTGKDGKDLIPESKIESLSTDELIKRAAAIQKIQENESSD